MTIFLMILEGVETIFTYIVPPHRVKQEQDLYLMFKEYKSFFGYYDIPWLSHQLQFY